MTNHVHTQIYVIKESNKGWSDVYAVYFSKAKAVRKMQELLAIPKEARNNFRLETWTCEDSITYSKED